MPITQLSGYNIYHSVFPSATNKHTSMAVKFATTIGITFANPIKAITSIIKINLQLVVYKFYQSQKHQYTWVFLCKVYHLSYTPEEVMLVELAKVCVYSGNNILL